ncbi:MAG: hypothetical protein QOF97_2635, partial [Acidimicrobiaceae bacterium]
MRPSASAPKAGTSSEAPPVLAIVVPPVPALLRVVVVG